MHKKLLALSTAVVMIFAMAACGSGGAAANNAGKQTNTAGGQTSAAASQGNSGAATADSKMIGSGAVKFDPNKQVNNGKPIELEYWYWAAEDMFQKLIDDYQKYRPNVKIKLVNQPWSDMWTKLPLALNSDTGPALFNVHNSQHAILINYLEPIGVPVDDIAADFINVKPHIIDGNLYYIDYGLMTSAIFYNKDHWSEAGLTDSDIPKTWDQLTEVAKKLTKFQGDKMIQSGFNVNGGNVIVTALSYQQGSLMFKDDLTTANFDKPETKTSIQMIKDLYDVAHVCDRNFGVDANQSFGNGQSSMVYNWGWFNGSMLTDYPDIKFGIFELPTIKGDVPFAIDRTNGESTPGINKNAPADQKEVAQDFLRYLLASDDDLLAMDLNFDIFPSKKSLADNPQVLAKPALQIIAKNITRYIWPGPYPAPYDTALTVVMQNVLYNGMPIDQAVAEGQKQMDQDLSGSGFKSMEPEYAYYSEHK